MRSLNLVALAIAALAFCAPAAAQEAPASVSLTIDTAHPGARIEPAIQGQFAEHLGRGIYEGIWVGPGSPIPNTNGYRNDVLAALRRLHVPVIRWPGGCFADEYDWRDGIGPRAQRPVADQHPLGRRDREQCGRHPRIPELHRSWSAPTPMSRAMSARCRRGRWPNGSNI